MKRTERVEDPVLALLQAHQGLQAAMWTALPGIIQKVNTSAMTAEVLPAIQARVTDAQGLSVFVTLPLLVDCPIVFPAGGGFSLTFPIKPGDECLVVFASRCIDAWWQSGGVQAQIDLRMHDLSDGFVIPGGRSQPQVLDPAPSIEAVEIRSDDGQALVRITDGHDIELITTTNVNITATQAVIEADVQITGNVNITGDVATIGGLENNGIDVGSPHRHSGGTIGGNTGAPLP